MADTLDILNRNFHNPFKIDIPPFMVAQYAFKHFDIYKKSQYKLSSEYIIKELKILTPLILKDITQDHGLSNTTGFTILECDLVAAAFNIMTAINFYRACHPAYECKRLDEQIPVPIKGGLL